MNKLFQISLVIVAFIFGSCVKKPASLTIETITGKEMVTGNTNWLSHEHLLVDFIGADSIDADRWNTDDVISLMLPYLKELNAHNVGYFVDATPDYLGRDVNFLKEISELSGIKILTNTGYYGARQNKFIPGFVSELSAEELAEIWIGEYKNGIDNTSIKPGFIKIGIDAAEILHPMHEKLVRAAGLTNLETGLTIASHTGKATGFWPQIAILEGMGVSPDDFIWVHANQESDNNQYIMAADKGVWISLDGMAWETQNHIRKLVFAKQNNILDHILISHDAGWYQPGSGNQKIKPFTNIFTEIIPELINQGFTQEELDVLLIQNPVSAFSNGNK